MLRHYDDLSNDVRLVELNVSCPNVHGTMLGYHPQLLDVALKAIESCHLKRIEFGLKLPVYLDRNLLDEIIDVVLFFPFIRYIVLSNSMANAMPLERVNTTLEKDGTGFKDGTPFWQKTNPQPTLYVPVFSHLRGGISGSVNKLIALSNIHHLRERNVILSQRDRGSASSLRGRLSIVGCGGIRTHTDVQEYLSVGADFVQVGSALLDADPIVVMREIDNSVHSFTDVMMFVYIATERPLTNVNVEHYGFSFEEKTRDRNFYIIRVKGEHEKCKLYLNYVRGFLTSVQGLGEFYVFDQNELSEWQMFAASRYEAQKKWGRESEHSELE
jgi:dihydroorotate dehydrogenase